MRCSECGGRIRLFPYIAVLATICLLIAALFYIKQAAERGEVICKVFYEGYFYKFNPENLTNFSLFDFEFNESYREQWRMR